MILGERFEKAQALEYKYKAQREIFLMQQKQQEKKEPSKTLGKRPRQRSDSE